MWRDCRRTGRVLTTKMSKRMCKSGFDTEGKNGQWSLTVGGHVLNHETRASKEKGIGPMTIELGASVSGKQRERPNGQ